MDTSVLEDIGLSSTEIKVFLTLLKSGESKAGGVIKKSGLHSSSVYNAINSLKKKGVVSYVKESQIKYYKAADPEVIFDYIDLKKREYEKMLPKLKAYQQQKDEESAQIFRTYRGMKTIISELLKNTEKGDTLLVFSIENLEEYKLARSNVYTPTKKLVSEKKVKMRGIFHENLREPRKKGTIMKKRYVDFSMIPNTMVINDKIAIISWKENEPFGVLIHSKNMAKSYADFFDYMLKTGKP